MTPQQYPDASEPLKCELAAEILRSSGQLRLQVMGWSMVPTVLPGDTLLVERTNGEEVTAGDIVLFARDRRLFVHRVVGKRGLSDPHIVTQGDGMAEPDRPIANSQVLGRIALVLRYGKQIAPAKKMSAGNRVLAAMVRRSESVARVLVSLRALRRNSKGPLTPCHS